MTFLEQPVDKDLVVDGLFKEIELVTFDQFCNAVPLQVHGIIVVQVVDACDCCSFIEEPR